MDYQDFNSPGIFSANAKTNPRQEKGLVLGSEVNILGAVLSPWVTKSPASLNEILRSSYSRSERCLDIYSSVPDPPDKEWNIELQLLRA